MSLPRMVTWAVFEDLKTHKRFTYYNTHFAHRGQQDEEARRLFTSPQQQWVNRFRGMPGPLPPPVETMTGRWSPTEEAQIAHMLTYAFVGSASTVHRDLERFLERTQVDEVILAAQIFDHAARVRSYAIAAEVRSALSR